LTNYLKEQASIRHFNVMDETYLINSAKEAVSFVSDDFGRDLEAVWKGGLKDRPRKVVDTSLIVDYVLPDYETVKTGFARHHDPGRAAGNRRFGPNAGPKEDVLPLGNERFKGPELLFSPGDIGLSEAGLPAVVLQSLAALPESVKAAMLSNVLVVGGNSLIPGFMERLTAELRATVTEDYPVRVSRAPDPIKSTWLGGARLATDRQALRDRVVTRAEYEEHGWSWLQRRFMGK
jgi:actin-related protein 6